MTSTSAAAATSSKPTTSSAPLSAADRCDRCGAQAYVVARFTKADLLFCSHHAKVHGPALAKAIVADDRARLAVSK